MSEYPVSQQEEPEENEFVAANEVLEEIALEEQDEPMDQDQDDEMDQDLNPEDEVIEIDMSNNSSSYFDQHKDSIFTVFPHPVLPAVVTGGGDNTAYMWTTHSNPLKLVTEFKGHNESVISGGFTASGEFVVTGDMSGKVLVHKSAKRGQQWNLISEIQETEEVSWIKLHPKQNVFAFGGLDGSVWVYQINASSVDQLMSGFSHQDFCTNGIFVDINDEELLTLVTTSEDGSIVSWNCYTAQPNWKIDPSKLKGLTPPWVSIDKDPSEQSNILAVGARDAHLAIINSSTGAVLSIFKALELADDQDVYDSSIEAVSFCSVQPILALGLVSGNVVLFDTKTWKPRRNIKLEDAITKLSFVSNSPILCGSSMNGKVYKWDSRTGEELFVGVGHHMGVLDFAIQNNGAKLITAGDEGVSLVFTTE